MRAVRVLGVRDCLTAQLARRTGTAGSVSVIHATGARFRSAAPARTYARLFGLSAPRFAQSGVRVRVVAAPVPLPRGITVLEGSVMSVGGRVTLIALHWTQRCVFRTLSAAGDRTEVLRVLRAARAIIARWNRLPAAALRC